MVWHDPDGPPTQNQWSEVVRETGIPMKWLKRFYDADPLGWTYGQTYYKIQGFNRYQNRQHKNRSIRHCCAGIITCVCEDCIPLHKKDLRSIEPDILIELNKLQEEVIKKKSKTGFITKAIDKAKVLKIKEFHQKFLDYIHSDTLKKLGMFQHDSIKQAAKVIESKLTNVLQWKIEPFKDGWCFIVEEGTLLEYKEAVFAFSEEKFKKKNPGLTKNKKAYLKKLEETKAEHKLEIPSTVCAFLNRDGGELFVGVRDDDNFVVGLDADRKFAFGKETATKFKDNYKRKIIRRLRTEKGCHLKKFLPANIHTEFIRVPNVPMIFKISVDPIPKDGIPAAVLQHEKEIHYVREEDEDKNYQDEKWLSWCRQRFPAYFNTI